LALIFSALTVFAAIDTFQEAEDKHNEKKKKMKENQKSKKDEKKTGNPDRFKYIKRRQLRKIRQREWVFMSFSLYVFI